MREDRWKTVLAAAALVVTVIASLIGAWVSVESTRTTTRVAVRAQLADRFSRAIDQLGDDKTESVRLGGVHSLLRIVEEDSSDRDSATQPYGNQIERVLGPHASHRMDLARVAKPKGLISPEADVLAVLEQIDATAQIQLFGEEIGDLAQTMDKSARLRQSSSRQQSSPINSLDFRSMRMARADLRGVDLAGRSFSYIDAAGANFENTRLTRIWMPGAKLQGTFFNDAKLQRSNLSLSKLVDAELVRANLQGANLKGADLRGADLTSANLEGANLSFATLDGAYLVGASLADTNLDGIKYSEATRWPTGFQP